MHLATPTQLRLVLSTRSPRLVGGAPLKGSRWFAPLATRLEAVARPHRLRGIDVSFRHAPHGDRISLTSEVTSTVTALALLRRDAGTICKGPALLEA